MQRKPGLTPFDSGPGLTAPTPDVGSSAAVVRRTRVYSRARRTTAGVEYCRSFGLNAIVRVTQNATTVVGDTRVRRLETDNVGVRSGGPDDFGQNGARALLRFPGGGGRGKPSAGTPENRDFPRFASTRMSGGRPGNDISSSPVRTRATSFRSCV